MSDLIDITLTQAYRIGGQIKTIGSSAEVAQCVADDLIKRRKAKLTPYEPTEAEADSDGGE
jgi:hypothetical protein